LQTIEKDVRVYTGRGSVVLGQKMSAEASEHIERDEEKKRRSRSRRQAWLGWWPWKFILVATLVALVAVVVAYQQRPQQLRWFVPQPPLVPGHTTKSCGCQVWISLCNNNSSNRANSHRGFCA